MKPDLRILLYVICLFAKVRNTGKSTKKLYPPATTCESKMSTLRKVVTGWRVQISTDYNTQHAEEKSQNPKEGFCTFLILLKSDRSDGITMATVSNQIMH